MTTTQLWDSARLQKTLQGAGSVLRHNWHLGFTSFGGPAVHFKIFHDRFVKKLQWIDEQMYQELFSISQALSGPGSTKMLYCINVIQHGFFPAVLAFFIWSLPGAIGMCGLSIGVSHISDQLSRAVYGLLSGLNAATVGIIALAAVELSDKAITDTLTRTLVFLGATAGMMYKALWYFPVLLVVGAFTAITHDKRWAHGPPKRIGDMIRAVIGKKREKPLALEEYHMDNVQHNEDHLKANGLDERGTASPRVSTAASLPEPPSQPELRITPSPLRLSNFSWKFGTTLIILFLSTLLAAMLIRALVPILPHLYRLFANLYLAGTIIFGGGPVVIPLLREYVVDEGWVSPRDFLLGLAIAQSFPGPNFNFAVFLGGLSAAHVGKSPVAGAALAFIGIFLPGMVFAHGTLGLWAVLRSRPAVRSALRGVNAVAVGLVYTAVTRIWQVG